MYAVAHDVIAILKRYAEVDKAVSGKADLPLLSVLQSIREHIATLVYPGFIGKTPPEALPSIERYLHADLLRLTKAKKRQEPRRAMGLGSQRSQTTCRQGRGESTT